MSTTCRTVLQYSVNIYPTLNVQVYSVNEGHLVQTLKGHRDTVHCVSYARDGEWVVQYTLVCVCGGGQIDFSCWLAAAVAWMTDYVLLCGPCMWRQPDPTHIL